MEVNEIVTTQQWHYTYTHYKRAKSDIECALISLKRIDEDMSRDVKNILGDIKETLNDLENVAPVAICKEDFERVLRTLKQATAEDEILTIPVRSESDEMRKYTLIADHDNDYGWTIWLEDENGYGHHILHNVEALVKLAGVKWAGEDYA